MACKPNAFLSFLLTVLLLSMASDVSLLTLPSIHPEFDDDDIVGSPSWFRSTHAHLTRVDADAVDVDGDADGDAGGQRNPELVPDGTRGLSCFNTTRLSRRIVVDGDTLAHASLRGSPFLRW